MSKCAALALSLALGFGFTAATSPANAQPSAKVYRMAYLVHAVGPQPSDRTPQGCPVEGKGSPNWRALLEGLRERGYVQGQNLAIACRFTDGKEDRALALAKELVELKVDLVLAFSTIGARAAKQATTTIPIVMIGVRNPVGTGLVASLAQPGANVTGLTDDTGPEIYAKYLQLLKEAIPRVSRVAVLTYQMPQALPQPYSFGVVEALEPAAQAQRVTLQFHPVKSPEELESAFAGIPKRADALLVIPNPFMYANARRIVALAAQDRLPGMYPGRDFVEAGGLLGYDIDRPALWRRAGYYLDKIFKGAKPGDLPVEQPMKFELLVNLKAARTLGITIPQSLLSRADEVIQ